MARAGSEQEIPLFRSAGDSGSCRSGPVLCDFHTHHCTSQRRKPFDRGIGSRFLSVTCTDVVFDALGSCSSFDSKVQERS